MAVGMQGSWGSFGAYASESTLKAEREALAAAEMDRTPEGTPASEIMNTAFAGGETLKRKQAVATLAQSEAKNKTLFRISVVVCTLLAGVATWALFFRRTGRA